MTRQSAPVRVAASSWISTVRADGRPHDTPLVAVWLDDAVHFTTGAAEQKAGNLRSNPTVILTTGCNQWDRGLDVVVEGEAVQVTRRRRPRAPRCRTGETPNPATSPWSSTARDLDASLLRMARVDFIRATDLHVASTVEASMARARRARSWRCAY
ncbi:MAG TPA: pyridoxamine 5'-phosphate oxidase family protein [Gaiellaceae bacterium]|nr:pyridoxamine 5'-phosphate oxidase family protein [Gaiellaceae bacterium]